MPGSSRRLMQEEYDRARFFACVMAGLLAIGCGGSGSGGPAGVGTSNCVGTPVVTPKRVVRLSEHQLFNAYTSLFGASAAATITRERGSPVARRARIPAHQR